jgi:hypothetical protein
MHRRSNGRDISETPHYLLSWPAEVCEQADSTIQARMSDDDSTPAPDHEEPPDQTLGGYFSVHNRPPAYEGSDGHPYTVSREAEQTSNLRAPYSGYLVFPRWAQTGVGIVGHVETRTLSEGASTEEVMNRLGELTLHEVQALLEEALEEKRALADIDNH